MRRFRAGQVHLEHLYAPTAKTTDSLGDSSTGRRHPRSPAAPGRVGQVHQQLRLRSARARMTRSPREDGGVGADPESSVGMLMRQSRATAQVADAARPIGHTQPVHPAVRAKVRSACGFRSVRRRELDVSTTGLRRAPAASRVSSRDLPEHGHQRRPLGRPGDRHPLRESS